MLLSLCPFGCRPPSVAGKQQLVIAAYARALEIIPRQLADNAGFDSTDILNALRHKHTSEYAAVAAAVPVVVWCRFTAPSLWLACLQ